MNLTGANYVEILKDGKTFTSFEFKEDENEFYKELGTIITEQCEDAKTVQVIAPVGFAEYGIVHKGNSVFITENTNDMVFTKTTPYGKCHLTCVDPEHNNYKFYELEGEGNRCVATYGRIGSGSASATGDRFGVRKYAYPRHMYWIKYFEKLAKGYSDKSDIFLSEEVGTTKDIVEVKHARIQTIANRLYEQLLSYARGYVKESCLNIKVTSGMVKEAERLLKELYETKNVEEFNNTVLELVAVSPRRCGNVADLLAKSEDDFISVLDREDSLCKAMGVIVENEVAEQKMNESNKVDSFKEKGVTVKEATKEEKEFVMKHLSQGLKGQVKNIYSVYHEKQQKCFDAYVKKNNIKTIKHLWHGSKNENWLSIVSDKLLLNPNAVITGKMFGNGICAKRSAITF